MSAVVKQAPRLPHQPGLSVAPAGGPLGAKSGTSVQVQGGLEETCDKVEVFANLKNLSNTGIAIAILTS